ncbi:MAG TPA: formimidoylglutamate deiminase [Gammaproteobacteria bacterium]|nr:formimidoylglutamate deiminase [Gammaproteobacteria bacterium]
MPTQLTFRHVLTPGGMLHDQTLVVGSDGRIERIEPAAGRRPDGFLALPGMPNAHSHAFQRAMAGYGERAEGEDSFWSWREAMYRLANAIDAEDMYAIARRAFVDMLRGGFTSVAEFHYVHHGRDGRRGPEMGQAVIAAARDTGIRLVMLPVLYQRGGFEQAASPAQARFLHETVTSYIYLIESLHGAPRGIAPHSLRAVPVTVLPQLLEGARYALGEDFPVHIHVAEQRGEVEKCLAVHGCRPIELLARTVKLDARWTLVHATHASDAERALILESGATVALCPITEAYLGDGFFAADEFVRAGGRLALGSDSNCRVDALEELRWLEFGQRLRQERRARLATERGLGGPLWDGCARAGAAALRQPVGALEPGRHADLVVFDETAAPFAGHGPDTLLDALVINGTARDIAAVYVGGRRIVDHGGHAADQAITDAFDRVVRRIYGT